MASSRRDDDLICKIAREISAEPHTFGRNSSCKWKNAEGRIRLNFLQPHLDRSVEFQSALFDHLGWLPQSYGTNSHRHVVRGQLRYGSELLLAEA